MSRYLAATFVLSLLNMTCSGVRVEFPQDEVEQTRVDDELTITGDFCTSSAADVTYPVKIMFIVDGSGSQQFTDQNRQRVVAVEQVINSLIGTGNTFFKIMTFNSTIGSVPVAGVGDVFTNDLNTLLPGLANVAEADSLTDYQGALAVAYAELLRDMANAFSDPNRDPAELSRTKYVVIFVSDGIPDPQCKAGPNNDLDLTGLSPTGLNQLCENQDFLNCIMNVPASLQPPGTQAGFNSNPGGAACVPPATGTTVCNFAGTACFVGANSATLFGGLNNAQITAGNDYNQPYQILANVQNIMDLQDRFQVGELRLHAGLVFDPQADPAIIALFGDASQSIPLMTQMADIGNGEFLQFYGGDSIDFLQINFASLKQNRVIRGFFAENLATHATESGLTVDTDYDGLSDDEELDIGSDPLAADTDRDGYGDYIEYRRQGFGFNYGDPCLPDIVDPDLALGLPPNPTCNPVQPINCGYTLVVDPNTGLLVRDYFDTDQDGLKDCEERALGTDINAPDTDRDGMPDRIDYQSGLNPLVWDADRDDDQDGLPNVQEMEWHLNPTLPQTEPGMRLRYRYDRPETQTLIDGRPCFHFEARRIKLGATRISKDIFAGTNGNNQIRLYILENLSDNMTGQPLIRTACVNAQYIPPSFKIPAIGIVDLLETDFKYLPAQDPLIVNGLVPLFNPATDCITLPN